MTDTALGGAGGAAGGALPPVRAAEGLKLGWLRRLWPILRPHRRSVVLSFGIALVALVIQVAVPTIVGSTIDDAIAPGPDGAAPTSAIQPFLVALTILAVGRGLLVVVYRYGLYKMAYQIEYDLRTTLYKHLTRLSFSFYDRVQSGQIISRANSDIRSVQMFLAFAPLIAISLVSFAVAVVVMLTINVGLTIVAVIALPGVYVVGVVAAQPALPAVVDHPGPPGRRGHHRRRERQRRPGGQVLRRRGAPDHRSWPARPDGCGGPTCSRAGARASYAPLLENLPRLGLAARPALRRLAGHRRPARASARSSRSTPTSSCCRRRSACSASS